MNDDYDYDSGPDIEAQAQLDDMRERAEKAEAELARLKEADAYLIGPGCDPCGHLGSGDAHADWCPLGRAEKAEARVAELEHVEDVVLACQLMVDANESRAAIVDRLLTIYVGGAMKRVLEKRTLPAVSKSEGQ